MKNGSTIGLIFTGLVVLAGGVGAGYYFIGGRSDSGNPTAPMSAPMEDISDNGEVSTAPAAPHPAARRAMSAPGQFTAPGAPNIAINETAVTPPKPRNAPAPPPAPVDTEASQMGADSDSGDSSNSSTSSPTSSDSGATGMGTGSGSTAGTPPSNPAATDSSAGASTSGGDTPPPSDGTDNSSSTGSLGGGMANSPQPTAPPSAGLYHVVAGVVHSESNAKSIESALRHKGYAATILHQTGSMGDTYTVQIGAYSSQVTADEMVSSLEHDGFPASVTSGH